MPPYELAKSIPVPLNEEPHQVMIAVLARITQAIVAIEGPVHCRALSEGMPGKAKDYKR